MLGRNTKRPLDRAFEMPSGNTQTHKIEQFFVCIGAQKAGTTWLARMLSQHPDLFMTPVKEIHFFDHLHGVSAHLNDRKRRSRLRKYHQRRWTQWHRWQEFAEQREWYRAYMRDPIDDDWYRSLFRDRAGRSFAGEATPEYALIGRKGFDHLKRLAPDVRLLYIVRNPVERAWSQLLHHCRKHRLDANRIGPEELTAITSEPGFTAHGDYGAVLDGIEGVFSKDQILLEVYEEIHADRHAGLERICRFIGLDPTGLPAGDLARRYNPSQRADIPEDFRKRLRDQTAPAAAAIAKRVGLMPQAWREEFGAH